MKISQAVSFFCFALQAQACLLPEERSSGLEERSAGPEKFVRPSRHARRQNNGLAIGTGDRFSDGTVAPRGLGTQPSGTSLGAILSVKEVSSAFRALAKVYGFETFNTPYKTYGKAAIYGGKVGGNATCSKSFRVFFNAAIHARERGSSDNLIYFLSDLLYANKQKTGITYGSKSYTYAQVVSALAVGIVFLPLSNPDGVAWDQTTNTCWRKNRNPAASTGSAASIGVDLNRNFDFLWDFSKKFAAAAGDVASTSPSSEVYHGTSAFSEPETKSIKWVMDTFQKVRWFLDIHSYTGDVLYNWGSDNNQVKTPAMNFLNTAYDGKRGVIPDGSSTVYSEYISSKDLSDKLTAGTRMGKAMSAATGRTYAVIPAAELYATSGASDDYAFSRSFANTTLNKVHGYTLEFGFGNDAASCPFYPTAEQYRLNLLETGAGFMEFLLASAEIDKADGSGC
jgi:hypothetical protein